MNSAGEIFLGVDLGGTKIEAAAVQEGRVLVSKKIKTRPEKGPEGVIQRIEKAARAVIKKLDLKAGDIRAVGVGAPGAVELETGMVSSAPNLGWVDVPLAARLEDRLGLPVYVDNDVNLGVAGEYAYGAGQGARHMIGIFVGTGIGGGVVINGELHRGSRGAAGEIGHMVVAPQGRVCGCGKQGCVEAYASKTAMESAILEGLSMGRKSLLAGLVDQNGQLTLTSSQIAGALEAGDELMREVLQEAQFYLALLTANLVNILDPEVIVFGGGLIEQLGEPFLQPIRGIAREYYLQQAGAERVRIAASTLGDQAGPLGAALVAQQRLRPPR